MATTRIRESYKLGNGKRIVRYTKPSEYILVNILYYITIFPVIMVFKILWWILSAPFKLIANMVKGAKEHN